MQETKNTVTAQAIREVKEEEFDNVIYITNKTQDTQNNADAPQSIYVSSGEKSKNLILISLLSISIILNIVLIWKR